VEYLDLAGCLFWVVRAIFFAKCIVQPSPIFSGTIFVF
jgi:hypothetical protein